MSPSKHVISSFVFGFIFWFFTKSIYAGLLCWASGVLIDLDHIVEYIIHFGKGGLTYEELYKISEQTGKREGERIFKKLYLVFHVAEIAILFWLIAIYTKNIYFYAVALGHTLHLIMDYIANPVYPFSYFMFWRIIHKFEIDKIIRKKIEGK